MEESRNNTVTPLTFGFRFAIAIVILFTAMIATSNVLAQDQNLAKPTGRVSVEPGRDDTDAGKLKSVLDVSKYPTDLADFVTSNNLISVSTYSFTSLPGVMLEDMSSGTTQLVGPGLDDTASSVTNIGFEFFYDGVRYTQFSVNANGLSRLGGTVVSGAFDNSTGFASTTNAPKIAPYFDDLCVGSNGKIHTKVVGSAPNRKLVVEWQNMQITRGAGCSGNGGGTFQMWLYESAGTTNPGVIQIVYGNGIVGSVDGGSSIGLQSGASTNFASVTASGNTVSYTVHDPANTGAIAMGDSFIFTPNIPTAPSAINFTGVQPSQLNVNWTDNSSNEAGFVVYRSTDGSNFTFAGLTAANAVTFPDSGLIPSTNYFYRVFAVTEGAMSTPALEGSQMTSPPGMDTCAGVGGSWASMATWADGTVPTVNDNVIIGSGCTVTVDSTTATALNVTIDNGGTLQSPLTGTTTTNNLNVRGNLTNNGILDFSTNGDTAGAIITFGAGAQNVIFGGTGATTDVRAITVAKGVQSTVVELMPSNFTVRGVTTDVAGYLTLTSGTFKISGSFAMTNRTFPGPTYTIPLLSGFWMNNPNYTVAATASGTSTSTTGLLRMTQGIYNIGLTGADGMGGGTGGIFIIEGGTINATRIDPQSAVSWTQSNGTINIGGLAGNTRSAFGSFELFSTGSTFNMSGGAINLINASVAATPIDFQVRSVVTYTGGVVNVGTAATATNFNFRFRGSAPAIVVDNTANAKTVTFTAQTLIYGNVTINPGTTFAINGFLVAPFGPATSFVNEGDVTGNLVGSRLYFGNTNALSVTGSGTFGLPGSPLQSVDFDSAGGVSLNQTNQMVTLRTILFAGNVTNSGKITLGDGGATTGTVQIGNTTTATNAGTFDQPFTFNIGTGGQSLTYLRTTNARSTGGEIGPARSVTTLLLDDNAVNRTLTLAGGDLAVSGAMILTNGIFDTGAGVLTHNGAVTRTNGYVDGNLRRVFAAPEAYTYHVGQNGYTPVLANVTANTISSLGGNGSLTVKADDATLAGLNPAASASRNWILTEGNAITADLTFTYLDADVNGNEADYRAFKLNGGMLTNQCPGGPCVNEAANTVTVTGVTDFSDWGVGEATAGAAGALAFDNAAYSVSENGGTATVTVNRTMGTGGAVAVDYATVAGGSATGGATCSAGVDYINASGTLNFGNGEMSKTFNITVCDETTFEPDETVNLALTNPTGGATIGTQGTSVLTILNDDPPAAVCDTAGPVEIESTGGTMTPTAYATLKDSFDAINSGTHTGSIKVEICGNTTETATAELLASGVGASSYTDVLVRPVAGARTIEGAILGAVVKLTGADNVTIDGRQNGEGTARDLTVRNNQASTATAAIWLTSTGVGAGATGNTIRNLELAAGVTQNTSTSSTFGIIMASNNTSIATSSGGDDNDNNSFIANRIIRARYGIATRGQTTNNNESPIVRDNIVGPGAFGADQIGKSGIFMQADNGALVSGNMVQFVGGDLANTTSGSDRSGIAIGSESTGATTTTTITSSNYTVTGNTIHDVIEERTFSSAGIILGTTRSGSPTNNLISNNFIYNIRSDGTSGDMVVGISITNGNTDAIVNNSISISGDMDPAGTTTSTNYGSAIRINTANAANNANFTVANNSIYLDATSNNATTHYYGITLNSAAYSFGTGALNYNNYYVNLGNAQLFTGGLATGSGAAATTEFASLVNWQAALTAPQDANSIQADPLYGSVTSDLHIPATSPNIDAGTAIAAVTTDIDGQARPNGAAYDIGADEFYTAPGVLQFNPASYSGNEGTSATLTVSRTMGSTGIATVDVTLNDGTAVGGAACGAGVDFVNPGTQTLTFGDSVTTQTLNVVLCTDTESDPAEMFTAALSNATTSTIGANAMATVTIGNVDPPFNGSYDVGNGGDYSSLTNPGGIFEAINTSGATGNITINIVSDLTGETGAVALNEIAGGVTVLIKPGFAPPVGGPVARTISGNAATSLIKLNGADNVTIDGSFTGGKDRSLVISNAGAGAIIWIATNATSGAENNTVKNTVLTGPGGFAGQGIIASSGAVLGGAAEFPNSNNTIQDNAVSRVQNALFATGNATTLDQNWLVTGNSFGSATVADKLSFRGMLLSNSQGFTISQNTISGVSSSTASTATMSGIQIAGNINGGSIARNEIKDIRQNNTTGWGSNGIYPTAGTATSNLTIANNFVSDIASHGFNGTAATDNGYGITIASGGGYNIYFNTVSMNTDQTAATSITADVNITSGVTAAGAIDLRDNIFSNTQTVGSRYAVINNSTALAGVFSSIDYNDYFAANVGRRGATEFTGLVDWQTETSQDANSLAVDPVFVSGTDLHLQGTSPVLDLGTPILAVTDDFDGEMRSASTPDIGGR